MLFCGAKVEYTLQAFIYTTTCLLFGADNCRLNLQAPTHQHAKPEDQRAQWLRVSHWALSCICVHLAPGMQLQLHVQSVVYSLDVCCTC